LVNNFRDQRENKFSQKYVDTWRQRRLLPRTTSLHQKTSSTELTKIIETFGRGQLKCDGTRAETRFRLSAKRTIPFKSAGASVQSTTGSRGVRISGSNAGYTMFRGSVKGNVYQLHSPVSPSLLLSPPCAVTFQLESAMLCFLLSKTQQGRQTEGWISFLFRIVCVAAPINQPTASAFYSKCACSSESLGDIAKGWQICNQRKTYIKIT